MAVPAALATFELLEGILVQLEFKDLLAARSVSSEWRSITEKSLQILRLLFIATVDARPLDVDIAQTELIGTFMCVVLDGQPLEVLPLFRQTGDGKQQITWDDVKHKGKRITAHTAVNSGEPQVYSFYWQLKNLLALDSQFCRSMQLIQPVCTALSIELYGKEQTVFHKRFATSTLRVSEGIRLGVIADTVETMIKDEEVHEEIVVRFAFMTKKDRVA
ncbi:hypothetical protein LTR97_005083 [Elasticomyces elasticus]|uniref:F-box domain-containing protein n=1 Tax=Elasticomyces elasticus TaxID=574655 RepID=A0AAN7VSZ8_9PEZI|nr:hypothetical protein LTR97_005083 [Elasticomyces elasticus]